MPLQQNWVETLQRVSELVAHSWLDETFKERFVREPDIVIREAGVELPANLVVQVDESPESRDRGWCIYSSKSDPDVAIFQIPLPPRPDDITTEELNAWVQDWSQVPDQPIPQVCFCFI